MTLIEDVKKYFSVAIEIEKLDEIGRRERRGGKTSKNCRIGRRRIKRRY